MRHALAQERSEFAEYRVIPLSRLKDPGSDDPWAVIRKTKAPADQAKG